MDAVAVVGMACRLPGAGRLRQYWQLIRARAEGTTRFSPDDLIAAGGDPDLVRRADFVPVSGVITGSRHFDWSFFGYSRAEAASIDPQQRVFLECAVHAIDDAGIDPTRFPGPIGVYAGADKVGLRRSSELGELADYIGLEKDFLATRVAYKLGLRGPAITVQTACSTSLTAIHLAAQSLRTEECDIALAGGVTVTPGGQRGYLYEPGGIFSPDGHCRPFDEHAAGTVPGEGVGVVVLKRLADALRDGDRIAAVILGSAINNDGGDKLGYTAPSIPGQSEVIRLAQRRARVDPADIDYVEAHGTGTKLGDPVEVQALTDAFRDGDGATGRCWLGAVKGNIGHTGAAAGVASFIKTVLMLEHRELVPTAHFGRPNPLLELEATPFRVCTRTQPWPERDTALAAVSSFGVGGTNAHVVVQSAPRRSRVAGRTGPRLIAVSAASAGALSQARRDLAEHLRCEPDLALPEVARTLAGRRMFRHRRALVAVDLPEAARLLESAPDRPAADQLGRVAFLFPGHGLLRHAAGAAAYRLLAGFRSAFDDVRDTIERHHQLDLSPVVAEAGAPADWYSDLLHQQLGMFALGYGLGRQLLDWGVAPAAMLGNSIGEYVAAALAGVWSAETAAELVYQRAYAIGKTEPGRMAVVSAPADTVTERIGDDGGVTAAVVGPGAVVISGPRAEMDRLLAGDALRGLPARPLDIPRAFHSAAMAPAVAAVREAVAAATSRPPRLRLVSGASGSWADRQAIQTPDYWAQQLRQPVRLADGIGTVLAAGCDTFIELGPGSSMIGMVRRHPAWDRGHRTVSLLGGADDGERELLAALGRLWECGVDRIPEELVEPDRPVRCRLPGHPFTAKSPELEPAAGPPAPPSPPPSRQPAIARRHGAAAAATTRSVLEQLWCRTLGVPSVTDEDDFFALGGESLMAVNLMSRIREQAGLDLSVTEFSSDPTFGQLVRLAERGATKEVRPPVRAVPLRPGDAGRPVFLAADAAGNAASYRTLASLLAGERPVYGLEPTGPSTRVPVEESAAHHVHALRAVQPRGPYTIGGWSFGAVVAHEMAHQLAQQGDQVDLLVCLDAFVPGRPGQPIGLDPGFLAGHLWIQLTQLLGIGPAGQQARRVPGLRRLLADKFRVLVRYRPQPVPCPAVVFKVGVDDPAAGRLSARLSNLYEGGVQVFPVGGDHWSMLAEPHVRDLASALDEALRSEESVS